jgi:plasmid stabilization system protein ParE
MQLRWSEEAADDLERITNYLFEETRSTRRYWCAPSTTPPRPLTISPSRAAR